MLDYVSISHQGGVVLWSKSYTPSASALVTSPSSPVSALVKDVLVEGKTAGDDSFEAGGWKMEWTLHNEMDLIFVVAYHRLLHLPYIPALLETIKSLFISLYEPFLLSFLESVRGGAASSVPTWDFADSLEGWQKVFDKTLKKAEESEGRSTRSGASSAVGTGLRKGFSRQSTPTRVAQVAAQDEEVKTEPPSSDSSPPVGAVVNQSPEDIAKNVQALKARLKTGPGSAKKSAKTPNSPGGSDTDSPRRKAASKVMRKWGDSSITESDMAALDFSSPAPATSSSTGASTPSKAQLAELVSQEAMGSRGKDGLYDVADLDTGGEVAGEEDEEDDMIARALEKGRLRTKAKAGGALAPDVESEVASGVAGGMSSWFGRLTGSKSLDKEDLKPVLEAMEKHLMSKNVAKGISEKMCEGVEKALVGKKLGSFTSVKSEVRNALSQSITRILTPKSSTDILLEIKRKRALALAASSSSSSTTDPFKMVFVGVNGVGKSTNLSKVCFWLLQNDLRVLIAACDTFRSGAVEQLRVHVRNLGMLGEAQGGAGGKPKVELFDKGYGKDPAGIAREAIAFAKDNAFDVVLIDTAGRMQDNEPLMRALSKLVSVNAPDKIVFVGEALVGNEAVDQLQKFDRSLRDFSKGAGGASGQERGVDGMILTKFDTVDDKVGAALSMTYVTGQPILFVGCGQTYTDLRHLRVNHIVQALLKD